MADPAQRRATYEDLMAVPEHLVAELIEGTLVTSPRPASPHGVSASVLGIELGGPFYRGRGGPGGWVIIDEPELHLHGDVLVPDLAGWRRERMPEVPDVVGFELAPDWVCEVLSPSTERIDRVQKMPLYARAGVAHLWFVDPIAQRLDAFRVQSERWTVLGTWYGEDHVRVEPFDAIELELGALWAR
jgi:Uma2 family endonuclease